MIDNNMLVMEPVDQDHDTQSDCRWSTNLCVCWTITAMGLTSFLSCLFTIYFINACESTPEVFKFNDNERADNNESCLGFPWTDIRLPTTVHPRDYQILIHPNLTTLTFYGQVNVTLKIDRETSSVVLHAKDLNITDYAIVNDIGETLDVEDCVVCNKFEQIALILGKPATAKSILSVRLSFTGKVAKTFSGLYKSTYHTVDGKFENSIATQFEPTDARKMFPCLDEPQMKSIFHMSIVRPKDQLSLANMPLAETRDYANDLKLDVFEPSVKMSTYLLAIAVNNFAHVSKTTKTGTKVSVYSPQPQISAAGFALETAIAALEYFETFFNIKFPLKKQDLLALSDFSAGAMENWGLVTFRDYLLLNQPNRTTTEIKELQAEVIVHELAHQWFGNLVTMKWWNDLWLNEGFATLMEHHATHNIYPQWKVMDEFYMEVVAGSMLKDGFESTHAISSKVDNPTEIASVFDAVSYQKGGSILNMIMHLGGEEAFRAGLHEYLTTFQYSNAEGADLWNVMGKHVRLNETSVINVAEAWTQTVGYPYVTVEYTEDRTAINIQQHRFLYLADQNNNKTDKEKPWPIPITIRHANTTSRHWLNTWDQMRIPVKSSDWLFLNSDGVNFHRVLYNHQMYSKFTEILSKDNQILTPMERTILLNDMFNLVRAGQIEVDLVMDLVNYVVKTNEADVMPIRILLSHLMSIEPILRSTDIHQQFMDYVKWLVKPMYDRVGWTLPEDHQQRKLQRRVLATACRLEIGDCVQKATQMFRLWMNDPLSIEADHRELVIKTGIKYGNQSDWDEVYERFKTSNLPSEQATYKKALAATSNVIQLNKYLRMCLDPRTIRPNFIAGIIGAVSANNYGQLIAWKFVRQHWQQLQSILGKTAMLGKCMSLTVSRFTTEFELQEVRSFFATQDMGMNAKRLQQSQEFIRLNIQYLKLNYDPMIKWLNNWNKTTQQRH